MTRRARSGARVDVAVVGGGLVGATLACALGESGFEVALIEAHPAAPVPQGGDFDLRVSAVNLASAQILRALGAWQAMPAARRGAFREMHVWDAAGFGEIHFDAAAIGEPTLGWIVENRLVRQALEQRLAGLAGVRWERPAVLEDMTVDGGEVRLRLDRGGLRARLVVGADGSGSRVRALASLQAAERHYPQQAVVANVRTALPHRETAWQRFLRAGPLAFLPLPDGISSIVWSTVPDHAQRLLGLPEGEFARALERAFAARLGAVELAGERAAFPLRRVRARAYVSERVALVGDAAHTIHPLAGQGANLGLLDAAALAQVLAGARGAGRDPGARAVLRRYERWRKGHNLLMQNAMDGFRLLFGSRFPPLWLARNLGLALTDRALPVKHRIMRHAAGLAGELPRLARVREESLEDGGAA